MVSLQERLQLKREPLDKWSIREQLYLAFAVVKIGDQNWMSVSRALKPFAEPNRPSDWFHQKNCAAQYGALLEDVDIPKRKKRTTGGAADAYVETPCDNIVRKLVHERRMELKRILDEERAEYKRLQEDMTMLRSGNVSEEQLDIWCRQIDEEEKQKEKEAQLHAQWLKERELRKQEIERTWRPVMKSGCSPIAGQKRKASDSIDMDIERSDGHVTPTHSTEPAKPALSPLLTSLLKTPSHPQNVATSSILHTAITSQRPINSTTNPTIASLLNSSASVQVSPGLQQLVSTAISQDPSNNAPIMKNPISDLLDGADTLPNLKVEDIESTILSSDDPLPVIKNEEVDVIISDLIENADIVTDPEEHLLDGNADDIIADFENELEELVNKEAEAAAKEAAEAAAAAAAAAVATATKTMVKTEEPAKLDPFEFQEDPEVFQHSKLSTLKQSTVQQNVEDIVEEIIDTPPSESITIEDDDAKSESPSIKEESKDTDMSGCVEIVEVVVMEDEEMSKDSDKSKIEDKASKTDAIKQEDIKEEESSTYKDDTTSCTSMESFDTNYKPSSAEYSDKRSDGNGSRRDTFTPEYSEDIFDDMNIEVTKLDKSGKAKRDYSRAKKKEDSDFDIVFAIDRAGTSIEEDSESMISERDDDKNSIKSKMKLENDRSNSPWTEEDEVSRHRRRYSTPGTPIDSIPSSPASSYYDDDREYKNWKKPIMLVYSRLASHKYASLFLKPITNEQAPGYHGIVKRPMDLQTIRKNIENGTIRTTVEFQRDILLMLNNAIMYNKTYDTVYNMAMEMLQEGVEQIKILLQVQADQAPARRETRTSETPAYKRKRAIEDVCRNKKRKEE